MAGKNAYEGGGSKKTESARSGESIRKKGVLLLNGKVPSRSEVSARRLGNGPVDVIVIDESNSFSSRGDVRRVHLTIVCTRTSDPKRMAESVRLIPVKKGVRSKYSNTRGSDRRRIIKDLAGQDIHVVERHRRIDYDRLDTPEKKEGFYMGILADALSDALDLDPNKETDVLIDSPPLDIDYKIMELGIREVRSGRRVRWYETARSASSPLLQVHDFITGVISDDVEGIEESVDLMGILRNRFKK